ncbi:MAG: hypothetical protein JWO70_3735 [Betaproteobacteria bacterium]|jgi:hypothetical protein|nr:hypothetical protein [Betaproteobacteria bacterium]
MNLRVRFIGKALAYLNAQGHDDRRYPMQVSPEIIHVGDLVRHPLFPGRNVYVVAREVDLIDRCVTVWLDELPGTNSSEPADAAESPFPSSAQTLSD